jgi:hypothetical protein
MGSEFRLEPAPAAEEEQAGTLNPYSKLKLEL